MRAYKKTLSLTTYKKDQKQREMKILFVASGNKKGAGQVSSFVQSQYDSLKAEGLEMVLFPIKGKGWRGYAKAVIDLRKVVKRERPDIIHAHYSTCGFVASLATICMQHRPKIMVSILGSFPKRGAKWRRVRWAIQHLWDGALVKSERTRAQLGLNLPVIPNGVNLEVFRLKSKEESRKEIGWGERVSEKKYVIWCSNPERPEKNWALAQAAVAYLNEENKENTADAEENTSDSADLQKSATLSKTVELVAVYNKTPEEVCTYMNAADCLLLTSVSEGSPNVIKEAMACNCPIVTTDVGDVNERLAGLEGCFVVPNGDLSLVIGNLSETIKRALEFGKRTEGRERIIKDGLTVELTAKKILKWYESI